MKQIKSFFTEKMYLGLLHTRGTASVRTSSARIYVVMKARSWPAKNYRHRAGLFPCAEVNIFRNVLLGAGSDDTTGFIDSAWQAGA